MDQSNLPQINHSEKNSSQSFGAILFDLFQTFLISLGLFLLIYNFLIQPRIVQNISMQPNFYEGDRIIMDHLSYHISDPKRGDIVVLESPSDSSIDYVKRVIGLPSEKVLIENGRITIFNEKFPQGFILDEKYLPKQTSTTGGNFLPENQETVIPADSYLVMGDNRSCSSDSRAWGTIANEKIKGKVIARFWPPRGIGVFAGEKYE